MNPCRCGHGRFSHYTPFMSHYTPFTGFGQGRPTLGRFALGRFAQVEHWRGIFRFCMERDCKCRLFKERARRGRVAKQREKGAKP